MRRLIGTGVAAVVLGLSAWATPRAAHADWLRAESERFIVYSDSGERALRDYVQKLEMFDRVMQFRSGLPITTEPPRKLPIYLVRGRGALLRVHPQSGENVVGTYFPTEEDIFAVAIRGDGNGISGDEVLMHEYAHHFMLGNFPGSYPAWFVEGFAEYYATAEIDVRDREVTLGGFNQNRAYWIMAESWIPLEVLLTKRPGEIRNSSQRSTYYPIAWLLTHWFYSTPERLEQLQTYLTTVADGEDSIAAMQQATGMTLEQLRASLRRYTRERLTRTKISGQFPTAEIVVERQSQAADDLLLINQRLKIGVPNSDRQALGQEVARLATRHGDDPLALLATGHAGLHFGDRAAGERALQRLLEIDPDNVEALQFLAQERLKQAREAEDDDETVRLRGQARAYLARAYEVGQNDYRTLMLLSELRRTQPGYPNENDILTLGLALDRAPQLAAIRFPYANALVETGKRDEAVAALNPLANNPHGGVASTLASRMIAAIENGQALPTVTQDAAPPQISEPEETPETPPESTPKPASE
ncbi:hypothetical protein SH203_01973 [Brevundimonas sp. SH203]|uniref:hypothetical protein n=1 Tax=Brevundimonas sp. SH203 TaxID=345167 RepID=UPI0009C506C7|nr:hypothetical protein [Brevundimonas sp. SH203]GAW41565.1 hypothetical protein SH203_01973 [Brevundimonas sp. SH203]